MGKLDTALAQLVKQAKVAGMPSDQTERFLKAGYAPLPWAMRVHAMARKAAQKSVYYYKSKLNK